jgi:hypothetical protein
MYNSTMAEFGKSFYYPDQAKKGLPAHRMCASGQRRAAAEAWNLLVDGGDRGKDETFDRAAVVERFLPKGADMNKHMLISYVVAGLFASGELNKYIDPEGNYTLERFNGEIYHANIFRDIEDGKSIY